MIKTAGNDNGLMCVMKSTRHKPLAALDQRQVLAKLAPNTEKCKKAKRKRNERAQLEITKE